MSAVYASVLCFLCVSTVLCKPLDSFRDFSGDYASFPSGSLSHRMLRSVLDPNSIEDEVKGLSNPPGRAYRTARSAEDECEKLRLCKLHASGQRNLVASFELYFVNKENAKLWDHQTHSLSDCDRLYGDCNGGGGQQQQAAPDKQQDVANSDDDYY